jgi:thiol-disulfide isomerase/thioredoxin
MSFYLNKSGIIMKYYSIMIILIITFFGCKTENSLTPVDVLNKTIDNYNKYYSISYNLEIRSKYLNTFDSTHSSHKCIFIKNSNSKFLDSYFILENKGISIYDNGIGFYFDRETREAIEYKINKEKVNKTNSVRSWKQDFFSGSYGSYYNFFLIPEMLEVFCIDTLYKLELNTIKENNKEYYLISIRMDDNEYAKNYLKKIYIDKDRFMIDRITMYLETDIDYQYFEWILTKQKLNDFDLNKFNNYKDSLLSNYTLVTRKDTKQSKELLKKGSRAKDIHGSFLSNDGKFCLSSLSGKLFLLDFWYIQCGPCLKAIPYLNDFNMDYSEFGLRVLGLNMYDADNKSSLKHFSEKLKISYPVILIDTNTTRDYCVRGYPTLYLLDSNKKVIYASMGFSEEKFTVVLDSIIKNYLKIEE